MINVGELIVDPDFAQPNGVTIIRSKYEVIDHEPVISETRITMEGIITIDSDKTGIMAPEADRNEERINVFTGQGLYVTGKLDKKAGKYISDVVVWDGYRYKVESQKDNVQYGYSKAVCSKLRQDVV